MIWYLLIFSDKSQAVAYAWSIMGLAVKLAQSVGFSKIVTLPFLKDLFASVRATYVGHPLPPRDFLNIDFHPFHRPRW
jgi:hypothetical protein